MAEPCVQINQRLSADWDVHQKCDLEKMHKIPQNNHVTAMAQLVEHIVHIDGVTGSSPVCSTNGKPRKHGVFGVFFFFAARPGGAFPNRFRTDRFQQGAVDGLGKAVFASRQHKRIDIRRCGKAAVTCPFLHFLQSRCFNARLLPTGTSHAFASISFA